MWLIVCAMVLETHFILFFYFRFYLVLDFNLPKWLSSFLQILIVLGMYNFEAKVSELIFPLENSCRHQIGSKTFSEGRWTKNFCGMSRGNSAKQKRCAMKTPFVQKTCQCSTADRDPPIKRTPLVHSGW